MRKLFFLILIITSIAGNTQSTQDAEAKVILEKVQLFFDALQKQDTVLYRNLFMPEATGVGHQDEERFNNNVHMAQCRKGKKIDKPRCYR